MNKRILELAREAGLLVHNPTGVPTKLEKFAQLIVQECAQLMQARKYADPDDSAEHYVNQGLATGVSLIKQHFGVEE